MLGGRRGKLEWSEGKNVSERCCFWPPALERTSPPPPLRAPRAGSLPPLILPQFSGQSAPQVTGHEPPRAGVLPGRPPVACAKRASGCLLCPRPSPSEPPPSSVLRSLRRHPPPAPPHICIPHPSRFGTARYKLKLQLRLARMAGSASCLRGFVKVCRVHGVHSGPSSRVPLREPAPWGCGPTVRARATAP